LERAISWTSGRFCVDASVFFGGAFPAVPPTTEILCRRRLKLTAMLPRWTSAA
jgi:hypothetical protein